MTALPHLDATSRLAFRHSRQAGIVVAPDGPRWTIIDVNDAYLSVTHRTLDELLGAPLFVAFPESSATSTSRGAGRIAETFEQALRGEPAFIPAQRFDLPVAGAPGTFSEQFWDMDTIPLRDAQGTVVALLHEVVNVTAREHAEAERARLTAELEARNAELRDQRMELELTNEQLQENAAELEAQAEELQATAALLEERTEEAEAARLRAEEERERAENILETMADAHFVLDREFRFVSVNSASERGLGLPKSEMLGRTIWELFPAALGTEFERQYRRVAAHGVQAHFTHDYSDGRLELIVEVDAYPATGGGVAVFWRDISTRVRAEAALRTSEEQLRTLANALPTLAWTARADGYIDWYNQRWYEYTGSTPEAMAGWGWESVQHPDMLPRVARDWAHAVATGEQFEMTFPLRAADGSFRRFLTRATPLRDEGGTILRWFGVNTDVEDEERARGALMTVVEAITDGFIAVDPQMRYTYVNRRAEEMWGQPASKFVGRTPSEIWPELDMERTPFVQLFRRVISSKVTESLVAYAPTLGRWIEARAYPSTDGGIVVFFQDITERRRAEEAAKVLADASQLLASSTDYTETLANMARAVVPRLGDWSAVDLLADVTGTTWPPRLERVAIVHEDPAKIALAAELSRSYPPRWDDPDGMTRVIREGRSMFVPEVTDEMLVLGARDAEHLALLRAIGFHSIIVVPIVAREQVLGTLTLCMTESRRVYTTADLALAEDLGRRAGVTLDTVRLLRDSEEARAAAEEANKAKMSFLATMSHELRTPLNAIGGHVQILEMGLHGPVTTPQQEALARVNRAQQHLLGLINDILSYAKIESGRLDYALAPLVAADVVIETCQLIEPQFRLKRISLHVEMPSDEDATLRVLADRDKLQQVLLNLLSNSLKFSQPGAEVTVAVRSRRGGSEAPVGCITVADTGIGIPPDRLHSVFEPFVQLGRGLSSGPEQAGTGLGLAISRDLARGMGGELTGESTPGVGSTFTISLAIAPG